MRTWDDEKSVIYLLLLLVRHGQNNNFFGRTKLEKIRYILNRIFTNKELNLYVKSPFLKSNWQVIEKISIKLTKELVFSANNNFIKWTDGCKMGGPISVIFSDIYMYKMEEDVGKPLKPILQALCERYVCLIKRNEADAFFDALIYTILI